MTEAQQLVDALHFLQRQAAGTNAYQRGKALRDIPEMEDRIQAMKSHLANRLEDGFRWTQDHPDHQDFLRYEDLWLDLLQDYEFLCNASPSKYETGRLV